MEHDLKRYGGWSAEALADLDERNKRIWELRQTGMTLKAVGEQFGVDKERVRQVCAKIDRAHAFHARNGGCYWGA